jgi:hypothetical protein
VLVNDGSTDALDEALFMGAGARRAIGRVWVLELRRNLGHQRAIAVGLSYLHGCARFGALVVMDADGEDRASDVPRLLEKFEALGGERVVFAERTRRSEGLAFRALYWMYRWAHRGLTGVRVRVGNFSVLPPAAVSTLVVVSDLWNHYAASVFKARLPLDMIPTHRGVRVFGASKMNFVSLVVHGLSAISVFGDVVGVRMMVAAGLGAPVLIVVLVASLAGWLPYWAGIGAVMLLVLAAQVTTLSLFFVFGALSGRGGASFIPERDAGVFVRGFRAIAAGSAVAAAPVAGARA